MHTDGEEGKEGGSQGFVTVSQVEGEEGEMGEGGMGEGGEGEGEEEDKLCQLPDAIRERLVSLYQEKYVQCTQKIILKAHHSIFRTYIGLTYIWAHRGLHNWHHTTLAREQNMGRHHTHT